MKTNDFSSSSSSSPSDRRIGALLRHLTAGTDSDRVSSVFASPTSGGAGGSVFAHLVQAPEDAILGVYLPSYPPLMYLYVYIDKTTYSTMILDVCVVRI